MLAFHIWFMGVCHSGKIAPIPFPTSEFGKGSRPVTNGLASDAPGIGVLGAASGWPKKMPVETDDPLPRSPARPDAAAPRRVEKPVSGAKYRVRQEGPRKSHARRPIAIGVARIAVRRRCRDQDAFLPGNRL